MGVVEVVLRRSGEGADACLDGEEWARVLLDEALDGWRCACDDDWLVGAERPGIYVESYEAEDEGGGIPLGGDDEDWVL